jgi:flagellin
MLRANQQEIDNILATVNRIAKNTQFGQKNLLDGSKGATGVVSGSNLEFVGASQATQSSGPNGYDVHITQAARRAQVTGVQALTNEIIERGEQITIIEDSKTVNFQTIKGETVETNLNALNAAIQEAGLDVEMIRFDEKDTSPNAPQIISLRHKEFGSEHSFKVATTTAGLLSSRADVYDTIENGLDVAGEINGEEATGKGQVLTGNSGNSNTDGLAVRYTGLALPGQLPQADVPAQMTPANQRSERDLGNMGRVRAGTIALAQNSLVFQIGSNCEQTTSLALRNMQTNTLGTGVDNDSGFASLADIDVTDAQKAQDAMCVLDRALEEVSSTRGEIGAFQKNNLESNLSYLRIAHENVMSSESVIRDADMAEEMTKFTRNQIMTDSATAMLAQANARAQTVLALYN